jgi:hypothetical protein
LICAIFSACHAASPKAIAKRSDPRPAASDEYGAKGATKSLQLVHVVDGRLASEAGDVASAMAGVDHASSNFEDDVGTRCAAKVDDPLRE